MFFFLLWRGAGGEAFAQNTDSLQRLLKTGKEDTNKVKTINILAALYINNGSYDVALQYANQAKTLAQKLSFKRGEANAFNKIGQIYYNKGNYADAIKNQFENLKCAEQLKNKTLIANAYDEIATIYDAQANYEKAIKFYTQSLELRKQLNDKVGLAASYNNIGTMYGIEGKHNQELDYYNKSLVINLEIKNNEEIAINYANIGSVYKELADYNKALEYTKKSVSIDEQYGYAEGALAGYLNLGELYYFQKKYKPANEYYDKALKIAKDLGFKDYLKVGYLSIANLDSALGDYKSVYHNYKNFIIYRDSLNNEENAKKTFEEQFKYDSDKKEVAVKAEQDKKDALSAAESKRQKLIIYGVSLGLLLVLILIFVVFRNLKQSKNQNKIIESQKIEVEQKSALVEHKQKEIIDSITYAKRLQQAILPAQDEVKKYLPESFLYYNPKDIVAGDFYWLHTVPFSNERGTADDVIYIAAADCTGHGVPGAMVSVVCSNALNRAVKEFALTETGDILDKVRELVIETFEKSDKDVKDGMDISLARIKKINEKNIELQWSGANNSLWYVQSNELIEVKANKQPIGKYNYAVPFSTNTQLFESSVSFYLFSDGYADQFSKDNKKLMKKKFKDIVLSVQDLPMHEQGQYIEKFHVDWKGDMEQTDDVLVIGVKV